MADKIFVLDSNIWISFIIKKKLNILTDIILNNSLIILSCKNMEDEISDVLNRPKLKKYISVKDIEEAVLLHRKLTKNIILGNIKKQNRDKDDDYLFALCKAGNAGYFVSGDKDILESGIKPPPVILSLLEFNSMFK